MKVGREDSVIYQLINLFYLKSLPQTHYNEFQKYTLFTIHAMWLKITWDKLGHQVTQPYNTTVVHINTASKK